MLSIFAAQLDDADISCLPLVVTKLTAFSHMFIHLLLVYHGVDLPDSGGCFPVD